MMAKTGGTGGAGAPRHPIGVVAERTGLTPDVLRVWQKRYGVVAPGRSERGRRLYTDAEVERLVLLSSAVHGGRSIGAIAQLSDAELAALVEEDVRARRALTEARGDACADVVAAALLATAALDAAELEAVLRRGLVLLSIPRFIDDIATPLLREIGERWAVGELTPAHEHLATAVVRRLLEWVLSLCEPEAGAPHIVLATLPDEQHEIGVLLAAAAAAAEGWGVTYLGANLPVADMAAAAVQAAAGYVGVSGVYSADAGRLARDVQALRNELPADVSLLAGGSAVAALPKSVLAVPGVQIMTDIAEFRRFLRARLSV